MANAQDPDRIPVDAELIRMFLEMTAEQRIAANDNAIRAIEELRSGPPVCRSGASYFTGKRA